MCHLPNLLQKIGITQNESTSMASSDGIPLIVLVCLYVKLNVSMLHTRKMEKGDNSKSIDARAIYLKHDVSPYHTLFFYSR